MKKPTGLAKLSYGLIPLALSCGGGEPTPSPEQPSAPSFECSTYQPPPLAQVSERICDRDGPTIIYLPDRHLAVGEDNTRAIKIQ